MALVLYKYTHIGKPDYLMGEKIQTHINKAIIYLDISHVKITKEVSVIKIEAD